MLNQKIKLLLVVMLVFLCNSINFCQKPGKTMQNETVLKSDWLIQSSAGVKESGGIISGSGYDVVGWYPTDAPATVMAALVKNNVYRDPFMEIILKPFPRTNLKTRGGIAGNSRLRRMKTPG